MTSDLEPGRMRRDPDGSVHFVCTGCGYEIHKAIDDGVEDPVCAECRWRLG